jgi:Icc-related predicted phosphoesterase
MRPQVLLHGHVHPYGQPISDAQIGETRVINVVGHRLVEVVPR